jgi:hypothetical protein
VQKRIKQTLNKPGASAPKGENMNPWNDPDWYYNQGPDEGIDEDEQDEIDYWADREVSEMREKDL